VAEPDPDRPAEPVEPLTEAAVVDEPVTDDDH
jgi:hypothetical protein